ncbi:MAG TPA: phasin family protein [Burkholderiales bacterium]|nr:phasin family protein [Betaproteobacteria bacterium]HQR52056.1 phasin family protein [Burkholderiales bacterium]
MPAFPEKFADVNKAAVDAALGYSTIVLDSAEKLLDLNMKAARSFLADNAKSAKALTEAKDAQEFAALQQSLTQPAMEKAVAYSRALYELSAETQAELQKFVEVHVAEAKKSASDVMENLVKAAPIGSEAVQAAVKSAMTAANNAYENITKAAKQVADITEAGVASAVTATKKKVS